MVVELEPSLQKTYNYRNMPEGKEVPDIERSKPEGPAHELTSKVVLDAATDSMQS